MNNWWYEQTHTPLAIETEKWWRRSDYKLGQKMTRLYVDTLNCLELARDKPCNSDEKRILGGLIDYIVSLEKKHSKSQGISPENLAGVLIMRLPQ